MEILFCGTAAAEGWPALFCTCRACQVARERGGKDLRSRAAYMIGDRIRIDFGPDSFYHQQRYGLAYDRLETLLVTHSHDDHWFPRDLGYREKGYSVVGDQPLQIWGNARVKERFVSELDDQWSKYAIQFNELTPWQPIALPGDITATPLLAAHDRNEECVNYLLEQGDRRALLAHDTGWYDEPTWAFLDGKSLHLLVLDCTGGSLDYNRGHLGCSWVVKARDEMARRGALAPEAAVVATHFSHNGGWLHDELEHYFQPHAIQVAYDGLTLTV